MTLPQGDKELETLRGDVVAQVLVVDDRPENLVAMEAVLAPLGAPVVTARSGEEALRCLLGGDFAVVLMDVEMPGMDGLETAALIRARPRTAALPILFMTAESQDMARVVRAYARGGIDYLVKPVDPDILRAKVGFFVELYRRGELIRRQQLEIAERRRLEIESRRAAELEKQIVGIVGHDIRGPLSAILATAQVQLRRRGELQEEQVKAFERIERSTQRIQHIVGGLLDFTRARVGRGIPLEKTRCNVVELVRRIADEHTAVDPAREIRLRVDGECVLGECDPARISQVFANLIDNAVKYSPPGSPVEVLVRFSPDRSSVEVEVWNGGEPIPAEKLASLFEPFSRAEEGSTHSRTSLGLGLFIVREIVHGHDGSVAVTSSREDGTRFRVTLPLHPAHRAEGHEASAFN
ncbi:MAG: response regulator [Myxococcaceae bacterium]|nr:response regulator [Myxococcaceae bacterium]